MGDSEEKGAEKKTRATYLVAGAILGGLVGIILGNVFVVSAIGMTAAVLIASKKMSQTQGQSA